MHNTLLELARRAADEVEIYQERTRSTEVKFSNGKADDIQSFMLGGTALRLLKNGKVGFSYTRTCDDPARLIEGAQASLAAGVDGPASFAAGTPGTSDTSRTPGNPGTPGNPAPRVPSLETWDSAIEAVSTAMLAEECSRVSEALARQVGGFGGGTIGCTAGVHTREIRVITSTGTDAFSRQGFTAITPSLAYPGTGAALTRTETAPRFSPFSAAGLTDLGGIYQSSQAQVAVPQGRVPVLFMPSAMFTLTWRLIVGTSGKSVLRGESPLAGRLGQMVAHPTITLLDDPWNTGFPGARGFDDEGTFTQPLALIEKGVLQRFYYDRLSAKKANQAPTGHGYKCAGGFAAPGLATPPQPLVRHLTIKPGLSSFADLVTMMDRGVIVFGPLGPHSGNIPNGDFSIGLAPGLVVEKGRIIGRAKDAMVSGNVYEVMKHVIGIGNQVDFDCMGNYPPVLFAGVSVSG